MNTSRFAISPALARATAFVLGLGCAWACGSPEVDDDCPQGADGCACALGFCDDGLTCVADVCVAEDVGSEASTSPDSSSSTGDATTGEATTSDSSGDVSTSEAEESSSTGEAPTGEPVYDATVDGVPTSFDGDPHAYISPGGTLIVRGLDGAGTEMLLRFPPQGPGTYDCVLDQNDVAIYYTLDGAIGPLELSTRTTGDCSITLDEFGEVGGRVTGSFAGLVRFPGAMKLPPVAITAGVFDVPRTPDES